jgi:hypothetical protein
VFELCPWLPQTQPAGIEPASADESLRRAGFRIEANRGDVAGDRRADPGAKAGATARPGLNRVRASPFHLGGLSLSVIAGSGATKRSGGRRAPFDPRIAALRAQ